MQKPIYYINRLDQTVNQEKVFASKALNFLYGNSFYSLIFGRLFKIFLVKNAFFSWLVGLWYKSPFTKKKAIKFVKDYQIDPNEFLLKIEDFSSFNDFFIRQLKPESRPFNKNSQVAIIPADGRYKFFQKITKEAKITVKDQQLNLEELLGNSFLANLYQEGSALIARLCPSDYHRFHFPFDCFAEKSQLINGSLYSVNPIAIKQNLKIFSQNKRVITILKSEQFEEVIYIEIGATSVGTIIETYTPYKKALKASEKGYFSFGGSALILLFKKNTIQFDLDLLKMMQQGLEIRCLMGQSMGYSIR